jgi:methanogenic corrinoid protein MtbC1
MTTMTELDRVWMPTSEGNSVADSMRMQRDWLAVRVADVVVARDRQLAPKGDGVARSNLVDSVAGLIDTLCVAVAARAPALFVDHLTGAKVELVARGGDARELSLQLHTLREVLRVELTPEQYRAVGPVIDAATEAYPELPVDLPSLLKPANPHAQLARSYLEDLFAGDWRRACRRVLDAADTGVPLPVLYIDVVQEAQREVGRLWATNRVSVAEEHYCTAVTRQTLALLQSRMFASSRVGRVLVATAVAGDRHELGACMVADFFAMSGWDTFFLGADTPVNGLLETIARRRADAVALSASMAVHVPTVASFVRAIRGRKETARAAVLVGGRPFEVAPSAVAFVGADGTAPSGAEAVGLADRILASPNRGAS